MEAPVTHVTTRDTRSVLERALSYGIRHQILRDTDLARMQEEGAKALVQIANHFGTAYLRQGLDTALVRFTNLASLYLEDQFGDDLQAAAISLRDNTLLSQSRGGSEMLKQLLVMPDSSLLQRHSVPAEDQRRFLDDHSLVMPMTARAYRAQHATRTEYQHRIAFGLWLGKMMGGKESDLDNSSAEQVIRTAILVSLAGDRARRLPTRTGLFKLLSTLKKSGFRPNREVWQRNMRNAPPDYQRIGETLLTDFEQRLLPKLKSSACEDFITGEAAGYFHVEEGADEDIAEYEKGVAAEWYRVTQGRNDPELLATVFLTIAAGMPPKRSLLLREGKALIETVRRDGFKTTAVEQFILSSAPHEKREGMLEMWKQDLLPEAEVALSDPLRDDTSMVRSLAYLRENCIANWKSSGR